jgi:hypothetical protein
VSGVALVAVDMVRNEQWGGLCRKTGGRDGCRSKEVAEQNRSAEYSKLYTRTLPQNLVLCASIGFL